MKKRTLWQTLKALFSGDLYFSPRGELVYYKHDPEWSLHVFECPSLDWSTTINDKITKNTAWEVAHNRMSTGLF